MLQLDIGTPAGEAKRHGWRIAVANNQERRGLRHVPLFTEEDGGEEYLLGVGRGCDRSQRNRNGTTRRY